MTLAKMGRLWVWIFALLFYVFPVFSFTCKERRNAYHYLPEHIGRNQIPVLKTAFPLHCDTVEVAAGKTTIIEAGTMLAFSRVNSGNVIRVAGTLILNGNKDTWVFLSGSIDSSQNKLEPGKAIWGGIIVEPGGKLTMEYTGIWGAPTPVTAFSQWIAIRNSFFTGATGIVKPDGSTLNLEPSFAALNDVDFSKQDAISVEEDPRPERFSSQKPDGLSADEKEKLLARPVRNGFWTAGKVWGFTGLLLAGGGGAAYYYFNEMKQEKPAGGLLPSPIEARPPPLVNP